MRAPNLGVEDARTASFGLANLYRGPHVSIRSETSYDRLRTEFKEHHDSDDRADAAATASCPGQLR